MAAARAAAAHRDRLSAALPGERASSGWYTGAASVSVVVHGAVASVALTGAARVRRSRTGGTWCARR
ncbi:hypothetical protein J2S43_004547 [Catenuloplanes nepalensis]|uniref:Uncharacterized protein n=1 Tax=Catenuloplanes nepalensis TaxID=587533 RepID=A0ABT9MXD2_9ACTN|nr:hypothetical protein [Catenuloplanes nepalensis]MDP9796035.1 hypothetical protein [Catenuloplanes nepalensis]